MSFIKAVQFAMKYQSCSDELVDLTETLFRSVSDGKISKKESSQCMKKYWKLVKAVEKVS